MLTKAEIKQVRALADKSERYARGLFVAEGQKLVAEVGASGFTIQQVYRVGENVSSAEMERLSLLKTPTPVLAVVEIPYYSKPFGPGRAYTFDRLSLVLDGVQDPGNLGTIIRLADWFGIGDLVCSPATADCFNPKVVQATMGAIARVRIHYTPLPEWLDRIGEQGGPVYGAFLDGEPIYGAKLSKGGVIVMGNEGQGISPAVAERVTKRLFIPPFPEGVPGGESLNVAVATAIVCSEFRRRG